MKKSSIILFVKIVVAVILLFSFYNVVYKGFVCKQDDYIKFGFSGLDELFHKDGKVRFYYKEYVTYELNGIDQSYLFYENGSKRIVSVDENNNITDTIIPLLFVECPVRGEDNICDTSNVEPLGLNIISAKSKIGFEVPNYNNLCNPPESRYETEEKIFAISDVEGNFDKFVVMLKNNNVITNSLKWNFGKGHLVLLGDFFDRGDDVTALLWLCYKLEFEANVSGGKVHFILGNHEQMNLQGNTKYVDGKYLALAKKLQIPYKDLYGKNTELGRWIRSKNAVEVINDILFVHAGISPVFVNRGEMLDTINHNTRLALCKSLEDYYDQEGNGKGDRLLAYINSESPLWYRGYFRDHKKGIYKQAIQSDISAICKFYEVDRIVVGHTVVDEISSYYEGKVLNIDVLRNGEVGKNKPSALLIEKNKFYVVDELGRKFSLRF